MEWALFPRPRLRLAASVSKNRLCSPSKKQRVEFFPSEKAPQSALPTLCLKDVVESGGEKTMKSVQPSPLKKHSRTQLLVMKGYSF